jgi:hypothetical protein
MSARPPPLLLDERGAVHRGHDAATAAVTTAGTATFACALFRFGTMRDFDSPLNLRQALSSQSALFSDQPRAVARSQTC